MPANNTADDSTLVVSSGTSSLSNRAPFTGTIVLGSPGGTPPTLNVTNTTANIGFPGIPNTEGAPSSSRINVHGTDTLNLSGYGTSTITLDQGAHLVGGNWSLAHSNITVNGGRGSSFRDASVQTTIGDREAFNVAVVGGSFEVRAISSIEFGGSVSAATAIKEDVISSLIIDKPSQFHATIEAAGGGSTTELKGLDADGYSYSNDVLSLYSKGKLVDTVKIHQEAGTLAVGRNADGLQIFSEAPPSGTTPIFNYDASSIVLNNILSHPDTLYLTKATPFDGSITMIGYPGQGPLVDVTNTSASIYVQYASSGNVHAHGTDNLAISGAPLNLTVTLDPDATVTGTVDVLRGNVTIDGGTFKPSAPIAVTYGSSVAITGKTIGGTFDESSGGRLSFMGPVSSATTVNMTAGSAGSTGLVIGDPHDFKGQVNIADYYSPIQLNGIVADSYTYKNDLLSFFEGGSKVDTLRIADTSSAWKIGISENSTGIQINPLLNPGGTDVTVGHVAIHATA